MKLQLNDWMPAEPDFELYHIYCHQKDYRLCHALNRQFSCSFSRIRDFLEEEGKPNLPTYAQFTYQDDVTHKEYFVIANQPLIKTVVSKVGDLFPTEQPELLVPDLPKVDYFLQLYGQFEERELEDIEYELNLIPIINAAQRVNPKAVKSYMNLMH